VWNRSREVTIADAIARVQVEFGRFGVDRLVISSNMPTRLDGLPYSKTTTPADPGVAVYFTLCKKPYCLPCDRWDRVADNLAAIAAHIKAMRGMERWGVGMLEQAFMGYLRLPAPDVVDWRAEFPRVTSRAELERVYHEKAKSLHPDVGGFEDAMVRLNRARDAARVELDA
jgi:hypothetical protein